MPKIEQEENKDLQGLIEEFKAEVLVYINKRLQAFKLISYEKGSRGASFFLYGLIIGTLLFSAFFLSLFTLAFYLGSLLGNYAAGFGILILVTLLILGLFLLFSKKIRLWLTNTTITVIRKIESDED